MLITKISGNEVLALNASPNIEDRIDEQSMLHITIHDTDGSLTISKHEPIVITDDLTGIDLYAGYIDTSNVTLLYPQPARFWDLNCVDQTDIFARRTSKKS